MKHVGVNVGADPLFASSYTGIRGGMVIVTADDPEMYCGITSFRIKGRGSAEENKAIVQELLDRYQIAVVHRDGVAKGDCVRVTPGMYTLAKDMDRFASALREMVPA